MLTKMLIFDYKQAEQNFFKKNHLLGLAQPDDITGMVLFLLSDRASWITGSSIAVDGGFLA